MRTAPTTFVLDLGDDRLTLRMDLPTGDVSFIDLLPAVRAMADAVVAHATSRERAAGREVACGPGCGSCCSQLVTVSGFEAFALARHARELPGAWGRLVRARFAEAAHRLKDSGLGRRLDHHYTKNVTDADAFARLQAEYLALDLPCPFLDTAGSCGAYALRPLICRQYLVTSPAELCPRVFEPGSEVCRVRLPIDLAAAACGFDGAGIRPTRAMALALIPSHAHGMEAHGHPRLPAEEMLSRFIHLAAAGFSRA